jgi:gamma-butyrobetaine dioxygenase
MPQPTILDDGARLVVDWDDGQRSVFHGLWLRDNCGCAECRHPSGQRLVEVQALAESPRIVTAETVDDRIEARFDDGHAGRWQSGWLREHCYSGAGEDRQSPLRLWDASLQDALPEFGWDDERGWLAAVDELGFAVLRGGPTAEGTVLDVAARFGFVRETNYGRLFDVRSVVSPTPTPRSASARTPTTRTATRPRRCSSCTASRRRRPAETARSSTDSASRRTSRTTSSSCSRRTRSAFATPTCPPSS